MDYRRVKVSIAEEFSEFFKDLGCYFLFVLVLGDERMPHDVPQLHSLVRVFLADAQNEVSHLFGGIDILRELDFVFYLN